MQKFFHVFIIFVLVCSCDSTKSKYRCSTDIRNFPKYGKNSKIETFILAGKMDTVTVSINGKITDSYQQDLVFGVIELKNETNVFKTKSDTLGEFKFIHIPSGKYTISARYVGCRPLENDTIVLHSGDIIEMKIELGHVGQDDLKKTRN